MYKYLGSTIGPFRFHQGLGPFSEMNSSARSHSDGVNGKLLIESHFIQDPMNEAGGFLKGAQRLMSLPS